MATTPLPLDVQTKVASTVSEAFADAYYTALQAARHTLATFYTPAATLPDGKSVPAIAWNGNVYGSGPAFRDAFRDAMPAYSYFEVQSLDAQVLDPNPPPPPPPTAAAEADAMANGGGGGGGGGGQQQHRDQPEELVGSVLVVVNGFARLEEKKDGPQRGFSETFVLVPNANYSRKDGGRRWVVQNQNFRYVV
ncbi:nuclear transport factor 2 domain-containing protein [Diplodia corticola]|uniref:Nuclear transport factor 2 domain-containing protein n=1 Tax=Diplodia corticola TaxID=236234 RepID=A0A1J9QTU4_9PEZI|nr:nuclear transport factor 2 domain-containing protein [Diplodia corticola]OJD32398.1 nuclear transport factor 2 domain-containing protein [Diplodia corticola]